MKIWLTIVDDFLRILERVLRYFGDISRLYQVVPEPNSKITLFVEKLPTPTRNYICSGNTFFRKTVFFFKNHRDLSHELRNDQLDKSAPIFIKIGHRKADLFHAGNLGFRVGEFRRSRCGGAGAGAGIIAALPRGPMPPSRPGTFS